MCPHTTVCVVILVYMFPDRGAPLPAYYYIYIHYMYKCADTSMYVW
jgi:hypothetical protein